MQSGASSPSSSPRNKGEARRSSHNRQPLPFGHTHSVSGQPVPFADWPRKYVKGELADAYVHSGVLQTREQEYRATCEAVGAEPNSFIEASLQDDMGFAMDTNTFLGGSHVSLAQTYLGERGFIAVLPLLNRNHRWTSLDASGNGLRNEAVLHLVDMLLKPTHKERPLSLNLSQNPISERGGAALLHLVRRHPHVVELGIQRTKIPRKTSLLIRKEMSIIHGCHGDICKNCGNVMMGDAQYCRKCGTLRSAEVGNNEFGFADGHGDESDGKIGLLTGSQCSYPFLYASGCTDEAANAEEAVEGDEGGTPANGDLRQRPG